MPRLLATFAVLASLGGCALSGAAPRSGPAPGVPLNARILPGHGSQDFMFTLNRPAYVAVFEVVPGRGVGLLYPSYGGQEMVSAGLHRPLLLNNWHRWTYLSSLSFRGRHAQPRYLYMVASERPLRIDEFIGSPTALRGTLGIQRFAAWNPYSVLDELDALVVPGYLSPGDWTTDLYVIWPEPPPARRVYDRVVTVRCDNGRVVRVPLRYAALVCPTDDRNVVRPRPAPEGGDDGDEGEEVEEPVRMRPEPAGPPEGGRERAPAVRPERPRPTPQPREPRAIPRPRPEPPRAEPRSVEPPSAPRTSPRPSPQPRSIPSVERDPGGNDRTRGVQR